MDTWNQSATHKTRPLLTLLLMVVGVVVVGLLLYRQIVRLRTPEVTVLAAAADLAAGRELAIDDMEPVKRPQDQLPRDAAVSPRGLEGQVLAQAKAKGEIFRRRDLEVPIAAAAPMLAELLPEGRVMAMVNFPALPIEELTQGITYGDRMDVVAPGGQTTQGETVVYGSDVTVVARDAMFVGFIGDRGGAQPEPENDEQGGGLLGNLVPDIDLSQPAAPRPTPILLAVRPEDALPLAQASTSRVRLSLVLHGRAEVERGELLELERPRTGGVELFSGAGQTNLDPPKPR